MPHPFPTTEQNRGGGSPDPRRAPSPGLSKFQRDPYGRQGAWLRTRGVRPTKVCCIRMPSYPTSRRIVRAAQRSKDLVQTLFCVWPLLQNYALCLRNRFLNHSLPRPFRNIPPFLSPLPRHLLFSFVSPTPHSPT